MASPDSLRSAIDSLHLAIREHPDPQSKQELTAALQSCMKVQTRDYQAASQQSEPRHMVASMIGGM